MNATEARERSQKKRAELEAKMKAEADREKAKLQFKLDRDRTAFMVSFYDSIVTAVEDAIFKGNTEVEIWIASNRTRNEVIKMYEEHPYKDVIDAEAERLRQDGYTVELPYEHAEQRIPFDEEGQAYYLHTANMRISWR